MVLYDATCSSTFGEGVVDEELGDEIGFLHEISATSTCLTMSFPSSRGRSSKEHSTSLFSDPVQTTVESCRVLSGLPKKEFNTARAPASGQNK